MITVLTDTARTDLGTAHAEGEDLWLAEADMPRATGWALKPEGLCRDDVCVPVPPARRHEFVRDGAVNAAAFWRHVGKPVLHDRDARMWLLAEGAAERRQALESLQAPDFTLPDLDGAMHSLSDHRGKKVFLSTWASW